jgi:hypothetical protein
LISFWGTPERQRKTLISAAFLVSLALAFLIYLAFFADSPVGGSFIGRLIGNLLSIFYEIIRHINLK